MTDVLRGATRGATRRSWGRQALVVAQVALSMVLIAVAGFIYTSLARTLEAGPGMRTAGVLTMSFDTNLARYDEGQARLFYERLVDGTREVPGVESAAIASFIPMSGFSAGRTPIAPEGHEFPEGIESEIVLSSNIDEGFFGVMDIAVTQGRGFDANDTEGSPRVAVVNQRLADRFWPGRSAVGQRFRVSGADSAWIEIVGVVPTQRYFMVNEAPQSFVYLPYAQTPQSGMTLVTRSTGDGAALAQPLRALVRTLDPELAVASVRTMDSVYYDSAIRNTLVIIYAIAAMGLMSLTLAFAGLYGLVSSSVSQRTREIGVRMAIGADRRKVLKMVLAQGARTTFIGLGLGVVLTMGADQALRAAFPGGNAAGRGLTEYVVVIVAVLVVTGLATYLPARRASRIEPTRALQYE